MKRKMLLTGTLLMLFLGLIYAWSLFASPLEKAYGWTRTQTALTFSISMVFFVLGSIASSRLLRRVRAGKVLWVAAALFLLGFIGTARTSSLTGLYIFYGVCCGSGVGIAYNTILSSVPRWFPDRTGFCTGMLLMGMGLGSLVLGSLVRSVMNRLGWSASFVVLGVVFFGLFSLGGWFLQTPEKAIDDATVQGDRYTPIQMIKTLRFWSIFLWAILASSIGLGVVSNASQMAVERGMADWMLPLAVGAVSIGNGCGRLVFGSLVDRFSGKKVMFLCSALFVASFALARMSTSLLALSVAMGTAGFCYGGPPTLSAALCKKEFGAAYYPENLSLMLLVLIPAAMIGPTISANSYLATGSYQAAFGTMLLLGAAGFVPLFLYRSEIERREIS